MLSVWSWLLFIFTFGALAPTQWDYQPTPLDIEWEWLKTKHLEEGNLFESRIPEELLTRVSMDEQLRVDPDFRVPPVLKSKVDFWIKVYSRYSSYEVVLFDRENPNILYESINFLELEKKSRNRMAYEITRNALVEKKIAQYRLTLQTLSEGKKPHAPPLIEIANKINAALLKAKIWKKNAALFQRLNKQLRAQTGQRDNVVKGIAEADPYFHQMEKVFIEMGLPPVLTRLCLVESSFNAAAVSSAGAKGVWQFLETSGKEFLKINPKISVDERLSPLKSTLAAAKLLRRNYRVLKNYAFAVIAYNSGFKGMRKVPLSLRKNGSLQKLFHTLEKSNHGLGYAGQNYFSEFLAMVHVEAYREELFSATRLNQALPLRFEILPKASSFKEFSRSMNLEMQALHQLNPDILDVTARLPRGFRLAVPSADLDVFSLVGKSVRNEHVNNVGLSDKKL